MTDPHAIVAPFRATFNYKWLNVDHKMHVYIKHAELNAGEWYIRSRHTATFDLKFEDISTHVQQYLCDFGDSNTSSSSSILEQRDGTTWLPVESWNTPGTPPGGITVPSAGEFTATFYDTALNKFKIVYMEGRLEPPRTSRSATGFTSPANAFVALWQGNPADAWAFVHWGCSKYANYVSTSGFIKGTETFNKKMRRRRGLL